MSIVDRVVSKRKSVFYGWWVVAAGTIVNAIGVGFFFYGWATFFKPLEAEFKWSRAAISGLSGLSRLEGGIGGPIAGPLVDKFGARKVMIVAVALTALMYFAISRVNSLWSIYVLFFMLSMGYNAGFTFGTNAAVAKWFVRKRGKALSILTTGNGVGGAIFIPVLAYLIAHYGWRWTAIFIAIVMALIALPLSATMRSTPEEMGMQPDGGPGLAEDLAKEKKKPRAGMDLEHEVNLSAGEALRTQGFWMYSGAMLLRSSILSSIVIHEIPYLVDMGISQVAAAGALGFMILISIPGRLLFGWLSDRYSKKWLLFVLCVMQAIGIFIFANAHNMTMVWAFLIIYGVGYGGAIPLTVAYRADLFGRKAFATINGLNSAITSISGLLGPFFAGYMYDKTHSYATAFYTFMIMILASGFLFLLVKQPEPKTAYAASVK